MVIGSKFDANSLPTLVLLDPAGKLITKKGRNMVMSYHEFENFPWRLSDRLPSTFSPPGDAVVAKEEVLKPGEVEWIESIGPSKASLTQW
jgi:hypothetical protein